MLESDAAVDHERLDLALPRLVAAAAGGATIVAPRRPAAAAPRLAGRRRHLEEAGAGLPAGYDGDRPRRPRPRPLRGPQSRPPLDGGRFWRALEPEFPDIEGRMGAAQLAWSR